MTTNTSQQQSDKNAIHRRHTGQDVHSEPSRLVWRNGTESRKKSAVQSLINGETRTQALTHYLSRIEASLDGCHACIMKLSDDGKQLSVLTALSLSDAFKDLLTNISRSAKGSLCMDAIKHQRPVYTDDVRSLPYWCDMPVEAMPGDVMSQWSCPLKINQGETIGSLTLFFRSATPLDCEDLTCLEQDAESISMIIAHTDRIEQLERKNRALSIGLSDKQQTIDDTSALLEKALQQRNELRATLLEVENLSSFDTMLASLTHEMNTPIGVSITAVSHLKTLLSQLKDNFEHGKLKRSQLDAFLRDGVESTAIIERNLSRSTNLITTFKQLSTDRTDETTRSIVLSQHIDELLMSLKPRIKSRHPQYCLDIDCELTIHSNPGALSQILVNLITNSHDHGFAERNSGHIWITARVAEGQLTLIYQDDGKGMDETTVESIYKPFFTLARLSGGTGLGMHICYNLVVKVLGGSIECESQPGKGTAFTITIPLEHA